MYLTDCILDALFSDDLYAMISYVRGPPHKIYALDNKMIPIRIACGII